MPADQMQSVAGSRAVILGAGGQDGHYLSELCQQKRVDVVRVSRQHGEVIGAVEDYDLVSRTLDRFKPQYVFHLAARSTTGAEAVFDNHAAISTGTINVLEAAIRNCPEARIFITGSGVQFKNRGLPISELDEFDPSSPYAVARIHSVYAARHYRSRGLATFVGYLFHHESPRRALTHVSRLVSHAAARLALERDGPPLELGNLDVVKEWTFAGDTVRAIWQLVNQDAVSEAVIGSGEAHSIREWADACFASVGLDWKDHVRTTPGFVPEYTTLVSNPGTIRSIGWKPEFGFEDLARHMVREERVTTKG